MNLDEKKLEEGFQGERLYKLPTGVFDDFMVMLEILVMHLLIES